MTGPRVTGALAELVADRDRALPDAVLDLVTTAVLDTVAAALAGANEPAVTRLRAAVGLAAGPCTVLVDGSSADPVGAALVNGTAAHALDFDDVDDLLTGHPSTVLVPAVLAVGEQRHASGPELAVAYWRGLTVMRALAAGLGIGPHYARGWHSTATLGVLGAAAAASVLLGLDAGAVRHALGIAASRAAGSRQNFGTMTKPLHAGVAAADGVLAARLAAAGFTADTEQLDSRYGFLAMYSGEPDAGSEQALAAAADRVLATLDDPGPAALNVKLYACCYATHAPIDAALDLVADGVQAADVERIEVRVPPGGLRPLITHPPRTELEGKFSMAYAVAAAVHDGAVQLASFTDEAVTRPDVAALAARVRAVESLPGAGGGLEFRAEVAVTTRDGATLTVASPAPRGHATRPATPEALRAKFDDCLVRGGFGAAGPAIWKAFGRLRELTDVGTALAEVRR